MKIIILGSTGILGKNLKFFLLKKKIKIFLIHRNKNNQNYYLNDFKNINRLKKIILDIKPSHIVNCIGVTKFNNCFNLIKETKYINSKFPKLLSNFCKQKKIFLIHVSTDCVFTGKKGNYNDSSIKDSKDLYGITKNKGEVKNEYTSTIRTSFIGPETKTKKSLLNWFLIQKKSVKGFNNAFFSGLTSLEISKIIYKYFILKDIFYNKIINVGGRRISKYTLLKIISKVFKKKISIKRFSDFKIDRSLNCQKFKNITKYKNKSWITMLRELKIFMKDNKYKY